MLTDRTTLVQFLIEERRRHPDALGDLNCLILNVALACKAIANRVAVGRLEGILGCADQINVQGEVQEKLDILANEYFVRATEWGGQVAGMVSEELVDPYLIPTQYPKGRYLLAFDPLDGSSNIDVNVSVGSIFSVLRAPHPRADPDVRDFLHPGSRQVCAGYAIYGPSTMLAQRGDGSACVHPRPGCRRVNPHPGAHSNSAPHNRVRDQRLQPTVLGTRGATLCHGLCGRARRPAPQRLQHALGRLTGGRNAPNPDPWRGVSAPAGFARSRQTRTAVLSRPHPLLDLADHAGQFVR